MENRGDDGLDRRTYLVGLGGALTGLSGRLQAEPGRQTTEEDGGEWPVVTSPRIDEWEEAERVERDFERSVTVLRVSGVSRTRIYEERSVRRRVNERVADGFGRALVTFFATRIDLEGFLSGGISAGLIAEQIEPEFAARLERRGVSPVTEVDPQVPRPEIPVRGARFREYHGVYPVSDDAIGVAGADATIPIAGFFSVWKSDATTAFAAGGAYPADNEFEMDTSQDEDAGDFRLRYDPERLRRRIVDLTEHVE